MIDATRIWGVRPDLLCCPLFRCKELVSVAEQSSEFIFILVTIPWLIAGQASPHWVFAGALVQSLSLWDNLAFIFSYIVSTHFLSPPDRSATSVLFNSCSSGPNSLQCGVVVSYGFSLLSEMCFLTIVGTAWRDKRDFPRIRDILS